MNNIRIRRLCFLATLGLALTPCADAQSGDPAPPSAAISATPPPATISGQLLTPDQLEVLVARIALYPDVLVAQILPASTYPLDVVEAERWVNENSDPASIDQQNWDSSVKAIAHYPQVLAMMNESLSWTRQLGQAVLGQQQDVLDAIQRMRAKAVGNGALKNTPEQTVQSVDNDVEIEPANPDLIYVPQYDPQVISTYGVDWVGPPLIFGYGYPTGGWFDLDCDWSHHHLYYGGWGYRHDFVRQGRGVINRSWLPGRSQLHARAISNYRGWEGNQPVSPAKSSNIARGLRSRAQGLSTMRSAPSTGGRPTSANSRPSIRNSGTEWKGALSGYSSGTITHAYSNRGATSRSSISSPRGGGGASRAGGSSGFNGSRTLQGSGRAQSGVSSQGSGRAQSSPRAQSSGMSSGGDPSRSPRR